MTKEREYPAPKARLGARDWTEQELELFRAYADPLMDRIDTLLQMNEEGVVLRNEYLDEIKRLKTVPMKYRRMEFNAQLQKENEELRATIERQRRVMERALKALEDSKPDNPNSTPSRRLHNSTITALQAELEKKPFVLPEYFVEQCGKRGMDLS